MPSCLCFKWEEILEDAMLWSFKISTNISCASLTVVASEIFLRVSLIVLKMASAAGATYHAQFVENHWGPMTDHQVRSSMILKPSHVISFSESRENVLQLPVQVHHNWRHRCKHSWNLKYFFFIPGVGKSCLLLQFTDKRFQPVRHTITQSFVQSILSFGSFSFARCMT